MIALLTCNKRDGSVARAQSYLDLIHKGSIFHGFALTLAVSICRPSTLQCTCQSKLSFERHVLASKNSPEFLHERLTLDPLSLSDSRQNVPNSKTESKPVDKKIIEMSIQFCKVSKNFCSQAIIDSNLVCHVTIFVILSQPANQF